VGNSAKLVILESVFILTEQPIFKATIPLPLLPKQPASPDSQTKKRIKLLHCENEFINCNHRLEKF
jgi:hypothetical protein